MADRWAAVRFLWEHLVHGEQGERSTGQGLGSVRGALSPDGFAGHPRAVEALGRAVRGALESAWWSESLTAALADLLGGTGCAILTWDEAAQSPSPLVACGRWENEELAAVLELEGCDWLSPFRDELAFAVRRGGRAIPVTSRGRGPREASAVAVLLRPYDEDLGRLVATFERPRPFARETLLNACFLGDFVSLLLVTHRLSERIGQLVEWNMRLMSDVERMGILLRRSQSSYPAEG
jgi:hypothetical protein